MKNTEVTAVIDKTANNFSANVEELPGFVCTAKTLSELKEEVQKGIEFHLEGMKKDGNVIPKPFKGNYKVKYKLNTKK